jgi:hypothetical protein
MRDLTCLIATAFILLATSSAQSQNVNINSMSGDWLSGKNHDEPTWFRPSFEGYEAVVPFFLGQSRLRVSDGHLGSNIKIEAHNGRVCWFYVGAITSKEMTWTLREGDSSGCPRFELFRRYK